MSKGRTSNEDGPRIHRTDEKDEFDKYPNRLYEALDDELYDDEVIEFWDDDYDEENWFDEDYNNDLLPL